VTVAGVPADAPREPAIRALVVDDEPAARRGVQLLAARQPGLRVVGECTDGREFLDALPRLRPDLVFLDIQMPGLDAFDVLRRVPERELPLVVFVTAYDRYAVRAFDANAVDYLLKPVGDERFARACERARSELSARDAPGYTARLLRVIETLERRLDAADGGGDGRRGTAGAGSRSAAAQARDPAAPFVSRLGDRVTLVDPGDVLWASSSRDYVRLHTEDGSHLVRETMTAVCERLDVDGGSFVRIHRSTVVRIDAVREFRVKTSGRLELVLPGGETRAVSRTGRRRLADALGFPL